MRFVEEEGLLACVHCGFCLEACPTYLEDGIEADSPRGRILLIRALEEGRIEPDAQVRRHLDSCLGCRGCETACPAGVPYGELIEKARPFVEKTRPAPARLLRRALGHLLAAPTLRRPAFAALRPILGARWFRNLASTIPLPLLPWAAALPPETEAGRLPRVFEPTGGIEREPQAGRRPHPPAETGDRIHTEFEPAAQIPTEVPRHRGTVLMLEGCVAESAFRATNRATARMLAHAGYRVRVLDAGCCGALPLHLGDEEHAQQRARDTLRAVGAGEGIDWIVPTAAGCGAHLQELEHRLPDEPGAAALAARVRDPLVLLAEAEMPPPPRTTPVRVAIHHACHLVHAQGVRDEIDRLIGAVPGVQLVPLHEADLCCGSAGTYNLTEREMAARLGGRKVENIQASGAEVVLAANPGCLLQIGSGLVRANASVRFEHPIAFLARAYGLGPDRESG